MKQEIDTLLQETIERLATIDNAKDVERLRLDVLGRRHAFVWKALLKRLNPAPPPSLLTLLL